MEIVAGNYKAKDGKVTFKVISVDRESKMLKVQYQTADGSQKLCSIHENEFVKLVGIDLFATSVVPTQQTIKTSVPTPELVQVPPMVETPKRGRKSKDSGTL